MADTGLIGSMTLQQYMDQYNNTKGDNGSLGAL